MAKAPVQEQELECCARTRNRWEKRIRLHYASFPVIKDVPCDKCRRILEIRVLEKESA
jgi:hypothetical protein